MGIELFEGTQMITTDGSQIEVMQAYTSPLPWGMTCHIANLFMHAFEGTEDAPTQKTCSKTAQKISSKIQMEATATNTILETTFGWKLMSMEQMRLRFMSKHMVLMKGNMRSIYFSKTPMKILRTYLRFLSMILTIQIIDT